MTIFPVSEERKKEGAFRKEKDIFLTGEKVLYYDAEKRGKTGGFRRPVSEGKRKRDLRREKKALHIHEKKE